MSILNTIRSFDAWNWWVTFLAVMAVGLVVLSFFGAAPEEVTDRVILLDQPGRHVVSGVCYEGHVVTITVSVPTLPREKRWDE